MHREVRCTRVRYAEVRKEIHFKKRLGGGSKRGGGSSRKKGLAGGGVFCCCVQSAISLMKWSITRAKPPGWRFQGAQDRMSVAPGSSG